MRTPAALRGCPAIKPRERRSCASFRALLPHMEVRIEEPQRGIPDIFVQLYPVHAGRIIAGFGKIIPPDLVALIVEDLVADRTGQHVELDMWDVFRRKLGVVLGRRRGVVSTENDN